MGSSEAVAHAVLLDTAWLQWEPPAPPGPTVGSGFCLLPVAASQSMLVPGLGGKQKLFSWTLLRVKELNCPDQKTSVTKVSLLQPFLGFTPGVVNSAKSWLKGMAAFGMGPSVP